MARVAGNAQVMISLPSVEAIASPAAMELRERITAARARREPVRIAGACTWLDAGRAVRAVARLDATVHSGIVEYVPGDLTLTARAGTTLEELERATEAEGQWLPFDPFGAPAGTIGATVATGSAGPLSHGFGTARDNVLGVEIVTGRGEVVRAGGRVVKNVAGFDLTRLMIGAWGTLGAITEVSVRLRARPEVDRTVVVPLPADRIAAERAIAGLRAAPMAPLALQIIGASLADRLGMVVGDAIVARLGGNEESVRAQHGVLSALGDVLEAPASLWRALRECEGGDALVLRVAGRASDLGERWLAVRDAIAAAHARGLDGSGTAPSNVLVHAWMGSGTIRVIAPRTSEALLDGLLFSLRRMSAGGRAIGERLTPALWSRIGAAAAGEPLARRIREAFDPDFVLNPGILGEALP